jgi:hypothetical protein
VRLPVILRALELAPTATNGGYDRRTSSPSSPTYSIRPANT